VPAVLRIGRFRFFFYSNEGEEPPHIHVQAAEKECKFWLNPVSLAFNYGFRGHELNEVERLVRAHADEFLEAWHGFFA